MDVRPRTGNAVTRRSRQTGVAPERKDSPVSEQQWGIAAAQSLSAETHRRIAVRVVNPNLEPATTRAIPRRADHHRRVHQPFYLRPSAT